MGSDAAEREQASERDRTDSDFDDAVALRLLDFLRASLADPALQFAQPPARVLGGFESLIYSFSLKHGRPEFGGPLILRMLRKLDDPDRARREAVVQNTVRALGFPAPLAMRAVTSTAELGAPFLIMEKASGRTLTPEVEGLGAGRSPIELVRMLLRTRRILSDSIAIMSRTQAALHRLSGDALLAAFAREGLATDMITLEGRLKLLQGRAERSAELRPAVSWLVDHRPREPAERAICHGDFQPFNILTVDGKVTAVLDWVNAAVGDPAMDVGATTASFVTIPLSIPAPFRLAGYASLRVVRRIYLKAYTRLNPIAPDKLRYYEALRCVNELSWCADRKSAADVRFSAYQSAEGVRRLSAHLRGLTGVDVRLPFTF